MARQLSLAFGVVGGLLLLASIGYVAHGKLGGKKRTEVISPYAVPEEHLAKHPGEFCFHVHPNGDAKFSKRTCAHLWENDDDDVHSMDAMMATLGPEVWFHEELEASDAAAEAGDNVVDEDYDDELFLPRSGVRLYSEHGLRVHALHEIPVEGHVYVVPQGLHFVWPMHGVGHAFEPQTMKEQQVATCAYAGYAKCRLAQPPPQAAPALGPHSGLCAVRPEPKQCTPRSRSWTKGGCRAVALGVQPVRNAPPPRRARRSVAPRSAPPRAATRCRKRRHAACFDAAARQQLTQQRRWALTLAGPCPGSRSA